VLDFYVWHLQAANARDISATLNVLVDFLDNTNPEPGDLDPLPA
jgi:hypothetical protein